jgi:hypothetical protein
MLLMISCMNTTVSERKATGDLVVRNQRSRASREMILYHGGRHERMILEPLYQEL